MKKRLFLSLFIILITVKLLAGAPTEKTSNTNSQIQVTNITSTLLGINTLYQYLNQNFLYDIDLDKVDLELTKALFSALNDPYSEYIPKEESEEFQEDFMGSYVGIGTYLTKASPAFIDWDDKSTYMVTIVAPFPGGPADRAGIRSGDLISHVNGETIYDLTATEASKKIRGKEGEAITLRVNRGDAVFDITLYPEVVTAPNVESCVIEDSNIGYISINSFNLQTYKSFLKAINKLKESNITSLIIDLRNNAGGTIDTAAMIADYFLEQDKPIYSIQYKEGSQRTDYTTVASDNGEKDLSLEIVILTNKGTASASEILTAALKENSRATIVGFNTFGKGIVQESAIWKEGYIKYTSAYYLTPNNNNIHEIGISPDIIVDDIEFNDEQTENYFEFTSSKQNEILDYIKENPEYTAANIDAFALKYKDLDIPPLALKLLIRNEYIYSLDYNDRPKVDTVYDETLKKAINYLKGK